MMKRKRSDHLYKKLAPVLLGLVLTCVSGASAQEHWVGTWGTAIAAGRSLPEAQNATVRETIHVSIGGGVLRLKLSNEFGTTPLTIGGMHIARSLDGSASDKSTDTPVLFGGKPSTVIPAGAIAVSDTVHFQLKPLADIVVSLYLPSQTTFAISTHNGANEITYIAPGDQLKAGALAGEKPFHSFFLLKEVDVDAPADAGTVVALGDSITDGAQSTYGKNARWPDELSARLQTAEGTHHIGVVNEGIGGNRILLDTPVALIGQAAVNRFDRDVLSVSGVKYLIVLEGINDIGHMFKPDQPADAAVTADQLIAALKSMVAKAHAHGIKVYGATILPFQGAGYYSEAGERMRKTVNDWIRTSGTFDSVIDYDHLAADPASPGKMTSSFASKDHLHPGDAGYKQMGDAINLNLF